MSEVIGGVLEVGCNGDNEVVVNHPDLKPDADGVGHIVFSPRQARAFATILRRKAAECMASSREPSLLHYGLEFSEFQNLNLERCEVAFHQCDDWSPAEWALAIAGEAGELCNLLKKIRRGDFSFEDKRQDVLAEIADIITYCDLLMSRLDADTGEELMRKFDEVSKRCGFQRV